MKCRSLFATALLVAGLARLCTAQYQLPCDPKQNGVIALPPVISGDIDSFAPGGPLPWVSPQLAAFPDHPVRVFDDAVGGVVPPNKTFVASILIRDSRKICTAVLDMMIMRTKSAAASPAQYDKLYVGTAPFDANHPDTFVLLQPWLNTTLNVKTVTLPASVANVAYLNSLVGAARKIDVALMDNTSVDYVKLTLTVFQ